VAGQYIDLRNFFTLYRYFCSANTLLRGNGLTFWKHFQIGFIVFLKNRLRGSDFHQGSIFPIDNAFAKIGT